MLLQPIIFLVGCAAAAGGACAAYNIRTEAERGTGYCFFLLRFCPLHCELRTSIAAVVLGCLYFCPVDCDASVMVVDCAAVETGCMLEKYVTSPLLLLSSILLLLLLLRRDMHFCFLVEVLLLLIIFLVGCADAAAGACDAYNISTEAERYRLLFLPSTFMSFTLRCFGRLLLLLFLAASISVL